VVWTRFIWLRIRTIGGLLWTRQRTSGFLKTLGNSWVAERLAASQEELRSMEWVLNFTTDKYVIRETIAETCKGDCDEHITSALEHLISENIPATTQQHILQKIQLLLLEILEVVMLALEGLENNKKPILITDWNITLSATSSADSVRFPKK
jgi:hypothetical protein